MCRRLILIDLDGVLNEYTGYEKDKIPPAKVGVEFFLQEIIDTYRCRLKIFTSRPMEQAEFWLLENNLKQYFEGATNTKEPAWAYIDDRCIKHVSFSKTLVKLKEFANEQELKKKKNKTA